MFLSEGRPIHFQAKNSKTILQVLYFTFTRAGFNAGGAKVLPVKFDIAQGAHESPAGGAGRYCRLVRMKETTGFFVSEKRIGRYPRGFLPEQCWKGIDT